MFDEMAGGDPFALGGLQAMNSDSVEEKLGPDGTHSRKEVHNQNGHRTVHITEEKEVDMPGVKSVSEVAQRVMGDMMKNGGPANTID
jgi:hypothetical protein